MDENDAPEFTPLEIPEAITAIDGPFTDLADDNRSALLDGLFGADVTDADLAGISEDIAAEVTVLNQDRTPANVARMEQLVDYLDVIEAESARRQETAQAQQERAEAALRRVAPAADAPTAEVEAEAAVAEAEVVAEAEAITEVAADAPVTVAATVKPRGSGLAAQLAARAAERHADDRQVSAQAGVGAMVFADQRPADDAVRAAMSNLLLDAQPAGLRATPATRLVDGSFTEGADLTMEDLAIAITEKHNRFLGRVPAGVKDDRIALAVAQMDFGSRMVGQDARQNFGAFTSLRTDVDVITASGGSCAPAVPRFEIFRDARAQSPVEDSLPVLGAPRGAIRWVNPPDFSDVRSGIGVTTDAEDAAGYGSGSGQATPKPCVHVDCPEVLETKVVAVSTCIEFGNLTFETFPEFTAARLADLAVNFASVKEVFYLNGIDAASVEATFTSTYGLAREVWRHVWEAAHHYRKNQNMDIDATLDWRAPDWLAVAYSVDMRNDFSEGTRHSLSLNEVTDEFRRIGLNVTWYYDSASGLGQAYSAAFVDGEPHPSFPTDAVWYLSSPGTFAKLSTGMLSLGIVRDSILNRTNDLQIFAEEWLQIVKLGILSVKGVSELCPNGTAPAAVLAFTCAGASGS